MTIRDVSPAPGPYATALGPTLADFISYTSAGRRRQDEPAFAYDVAVVGLGDVGLSTALDYHASGDRVVGLDASADRLISIGTGLVDLTDRDHARLDAALTDDAFQITADASVISQAQSVIICVPAPLDDDFVRDLEPLKAACAAAVAYAAPGQLLMLTSMASVRCTESLLAKPLAARGLEVGTDVFVAYRDPRTRVGPRG